MANEQGYQGWANYPTWCVALWIDNDEYLYNQYIGMAADWVDDEDELAIYRIAEAIEEYVMEMVPDVGNNLYSDILNYTMGMVDWHELATHYLEIARENDGQDNGDS